MIGLCLLLIVVGFGVAAPLTYVMAKVGRRLGQLDKPGERKIHAVPTPATGGVAIFWAVMGPLVLGLLLAWFIPAETWAELFPALVGHLPGVRGQTAMAAALVLTAAGLHVTGLVDDRVNLGPFVKLVIQMVAAGVLAVFFNVRLMEMWGVVPAVVVTVLWFTVVTNAFNFMDNMNGLSAGTAVICGGIFMAAALLNGQWFIAGLLGLVVGALLGFLVFNYPRAIIFMGDGGSLVVGYLMAFCSVRITYFEPGEAAPPEAALPGGWWALATPVVVLAIPLYDFLSVTLIRLSQGKSPFKGDTQHFSHRLVRKGLRPAIAVAVIWMCALATGLGGVLLRWLEMWEAAVVIVQCGVVVVVLAMLEATRAAGERE